MAAAALANPLAGFTSSLVQVSRSFRAVPKGTSSLRRALSTNAGRQRQLTPELKRMGSRFDPMGQSASKFGKQAGKLRPILLKAKKVLQRLVRAVKKLAQQWGTITQSTLQFAKSLGVVGKISGVLGGRLEALTKVWDLVNLVMKTNPLILIATLLAPFIQQLIEYALDSDLGKQIMSGLFSTMQVLIKVAFVGMLPTILGVKAGIAIFKAIVRFIKDPVGFIKNDLPKGFRHIGEATLGFLGGAAGALKAGFKTAGGFLKLPADLLIGFANAVVDALNHLPGVNLSHLPQLAKGGIVAPRTGGVPVVLAEAGEAEAVIPLPKLEQLLARTRQIARASAAAPGRASSLTHYYEPEGRGSYGIAEELFFLAQTHSSRR